ncbi:IPT/TIG domain-containing protein [Bdellovibrionota bacterium FG-1]
MRETIMSVRSIWNFGRNLGFLILIAAALGAGCSKNDGLSNKQKADSANAKTEPDAGTPGTVFNGGGASAPLVRITSISPESGPVTGATVLKIIGSDFKVGVKVTLDSGTCTRVRFVSSSEIYCMTPSHALGAVKLQVSNPGYEAATADTLQSFQTTLENAYTYVVASKTLGAAAVVPAGSIKAIGTGIRMEATVGEPGAVIPQDQAGQGVKLHPGVQGVLYEKK